MSEPSPAFRRYLERFPEVEKAHMELSLVVNRQGPLGERERRLLRLGTAIGQQNRAAVESCVRRALAEGLTPQELRHAALLALPSLGFPAMLAALGWIEAVLGEET